MRIKTSLLPRIQLAVVLTVAAGCATFFGYLWVGSGGRIPVITPEGYRVAVDIPHVSNLVRSSSVMSAGIKIGQVADLTLDGKRAHVVMELDREHAPIHQGAKVNVRFKTLLGESFLEITDGKGAAVAEEAKLPAGSGVPAVEPNDVLNSLDQPTRDALGRMVRSLGAATEGRRDDLSAALSGLGAVGRQGRDALDSLADQSKDLRKLTGDAATLVAALDTRQGQIAQLVSDANAVTKVTAGDRGRIEALMRRLPGLLRSARSASTGLDQLAGKLAPVARNLRGAAPELTAALKQLPATAEDLRGLLPALDGALDAAPPTLRRVPAVAGDARALLPPLDVALRDVNPMLAYLGPYDREITGFFTNFGQALNSENGLIKVMLVFSEKSLRGLPASTNPPLIQRSNPYPAPGSLNDLQPFTGKYPRVEEEGG